MKRSKDNIVARIRAKIKPEQRIYVKKNLEISEQVSHLLKQKGWTQKEFAEKLEKEPSEVSRWLTGLHNLTLQSLAKMEAVLSEEIIITPQEACKKYHSIEYVVLKVHAQENETPVERVHSYPDNPQFEIKPVLANAS